MDLRDWRPSGMGRVVLLLAAVLALLGFFPLLLCGLVYLWQLLCLALPAAPVPLVLLALKKRKKTVVSAFLLCLLLMLGSAAWVAHHPFFRCPEEYRPYISSEEEARIVGYNGGLYSYRIPIFPVCVSVTAADEDSVCVRTQYLFFGSTEMEIGQSDSADPVPSLIRGLH